MVSYNSRNTLTAQKAFYSKKSLLKETIYYMIQFQPFNKLEMFFWNLSIVHHEFSVKHYAL